MMSRDIMQEGYQHAWTVGSLWAFLERQDFNRTVALHIALTDDVRSQLHRGDEATVWNFTIGIDTATDTIVLTNIPRKPGGINDVIHTG